jgi:iron complex transport system substrate-binding protein
MVVLIGEAEKIIGAPDGIKRDILLRTVHPGIVDIASPMQAGTINAEEIIRIEPDIVLVRRHVAESISESEKLENMGIPYVVLDFHNIDELKKCIEIVGEIFNKQDITSQYLAYMNETFSLVESRLYGLDESEKISLFHSTQDPLRTALAGTICEEITTRAGVINVSLNDVFPSDNTTADITIEQLYIWDPDVIVVNEYYAKPYIMQNNRWIGLSAVINEMVVTLPLGISRWGHHGSIEPHMATLFIAWRFYPERFNDVDMEKIIFDYYTQFFRLDMDDELVERIITGEGMREPK